MAFYRVAADVILVLHTAVVVFVVGGFVLIMLGNLRHWSWVNDLWFRCVHLGAILFVLISTLFGYACPLTTFESWLRRQAGGAGYESGFIEYWLQQLIFYDAPAWIFVLAYTTFGLAVLATWWLFPPRKRN